MTKELPDYIGHRQRLRDRFLLSEGRDMADYELIELLLTLVIPRRDVKPLAKKLVQAFGSFAGVINASDYRVREINGVTEGVIMILKIIKTSSQRLTWQNLATDELPILMNVDNLVDYCRGSMAYAEVEELHLLYLDAKLKLQACELIQRGTTCSVSVSPREIVRRAISHNTSNIIMVHNHPSGSARPSESDILLTKTINQACRLMNIQLQEHLIITPADYFSFAQHKML